jgi:hypothetical protein
MTRTISVAAIALAIAGAAACGKKGGGAKPLAERALAPVTHKVNNVDLAISLPEDMKGGPKDAATLQWNEAGGLTLDVLIETSKPPVAMQNELNAAASLQLNVTRADEVPDGWLVTAGAADGSTTRVRRQIKLGDTRAVHLGQGREEGRLARVDL